jgi:DNA polymerase-3 subunit delta
LAKKTSIELFSEVKQSLEQGEVAPVYVFWAEEEFLVDQLQDKIMGLVPPEQRDFNYDLLYGQDVTVNRVLDIARSFPMMADRRVVIVRDYHQLRSKSGEGQLNDFINYFEQPNPSTVLVLIDAKKPNGNTKFGRALRKKSVSYLKFKEIPDYRLPDWVAEWSRMQFGKKLHPEAAQLLVQSVGNSLQLLSTELDKLCTFKDTSDQLTKSDVKEIIGVYREYDIFELKDALLNRDLNQTLFIAEQMLQLSKSDTGEVIKTVGFFYSLFSNIWQIQHLRRKGMGQSQVQEALGIRNSWYFKNLWKDASRFRYAELPRIFDALLDADMAAKGVGKLDPASILLLMIRRIIG